MSIEIVNQAMEAIYLNKDEDIHIKPYNLNKLISFTAGSLPTAVLMNRYTFYIDTTLFNTTLKLILGGKSKVPNISYIKSDKEKSKEFDFLFKRIQQQFSYSDPDMAFMKPLYLKMFSNIETLKKFFIYYGVDRSYWKKFGLKLKSVKIEKPKDKPKWW